MKPRDRLVVCVLVAVAGLAAMWLVLVSPKRKDAADVGAKLSIAQTRLGAAQAQLAGAKAAEAQFTTNLGVVKSLYKAVPATDGVPHLLVSLDRTSQYKRVDFRVITVATVASTSPPGAVAPVPGGLSPIRFTFTFNGGYIALQHFLRSVDHYTLLKAGKVAAHGRLLTVQSVSLSPPSEPGGASTQASVTATAYSQPPAAGTLTPATATTTASTPALPTPATTAASTPALPTPATIPAATVAPPSTNPTR